jgi:hypothetical protein
VVAPLEFIEAVASNPQEIVVCREHDAIERKFNDSLESVDGGDTATQFGYLALPSLLELELVWRRSAAEQAMQPGRVRGGQGVYDCIHVSFPDEWNAAQRRDEQRHRSGHFVMPQ